jgi:methionyl-tRNA formyltransferase
MSVGAPFRTVALLGRDGGLALLRDGLLRNNLVDLVGVITHGKLPKAEGGGARPEMQLYESVCAESNVPLTVLDGSEAKQLEKHLPRDLDLLVVLSWRFILAPAVFKTPRLGALNLHRGALPEFAGAEPVRRAVEAGETRTAITAHKMVEKVDMGPEVARVWLDLPPPPPNTVSAEYAEVIKKKLLGLYGSLARTAIKALAA